MKRIGIKMNHVNLTGLAERVKPFRYISLKFILEPAHSVHVSYLKLNISAIIIVTQHRSSLWNGVEWIGESMGIFPNKSAKLVMILMQL